MSEIKALSDIVSALEEVDDQDAINRILDYIVARFGGPRSQSSGTLCHSELRSPQPASRSMTDNLANELPGIAILTDSGDFRLTVRDPKAKNTNDAAIRLALVAIYSYCQLTREKTTSSKRIVKPILENWRAYTGNTRAALAQHPGIIRNGDALSLDHHATLEAENIIHDIKDPEVEGTWQPNGRKSRKSGAKTIGASSVDEE